jgi:nitrite reductase (NO-forming)
MSLVTGGTGTLGRLVVIAGVALATACGAAATTSGPSAGVAVQAPAAPAGAQQVTVTVGNSMQFAPASLVVRAGQPVELTLRNGGGIPHDFALAEGVSRPVKIEAQGGRTARGAFTIDTPGTYAFVCTVPGHAAAGMRGTITAQ